jgi:heme-degrading monooxygenase HmoA
MIARSWDGLTPAAKADEYADYVRRTGLTELAGTDGNRGVYLLRRKEGDQARFRVLSLWDSVDGIRRFAGDDVEKARYFPEDARFLLGLPRNVEHFEVVAAENGAARESASLAEELRIIARGDAWHGPSLEEVLAGVTPEIAASRPIAAGHTIWEVVLHVTGWTDVSRTRLEGTAMEEPEQGDFPPVPEPSAAAWEDAKRDLFRAHDALVARVERLSPADLDAPVPGRGFPARFLVRGEIRHTVYHTGQIALLRKVGASA